MHEGINVEIECLSETTGIWVSCVTHFKLLPYDNLCLNNLTPTFII